MDTNDQVVRIEQRLEDQTRFLIFTVDDAFAFGLPFMMGWMTQKVFLGAFIGFVVYLVWKHVKGDGGMARLVAALYWFCPPAITPYRSFPPSHIQHWRG
ncbi:type IV conjugative transfer system protein TraL [uncultured Roseobacter sp.]|uniref:type IV conjugative transfer system protein TraL n=1 Tax=uncultured Roseobacter sp. TaxID=114847 RepID=UPI002607AF0D|nr:type IV conjugative transfer system protein TraL [uncultured Roseobacter sp.]